jgi:nucleolar pre-ribosomal-associated protein 2
MIHILPVSRSAPHLRDAGFTTILEKTLVENFDRDLEGSTVTSNDREHARGVSESSATIADDAQPSRKRKRGSPGASPSKRTESATIDPTLLFRVIQIALQSITGFSAANTKVHDTTQTELMKMVLRTESAQASRILRFWLVAVHKLVARALSSDVTQAVESLVDLSVVLEIWDLRIVDSSDNTGSSDDFASECLVPTLQLVEDLRSIRPVVAAPPSIRTLEITMQALDKLLTRHLLAPSRAAFFATLHEEKDTKAPSHQDASSFTSSLGPLRAMLLQAAQIEDAGEAIPAHLISSFKAVAYLLDLAVRASPSSTPKSRLAERPWIQAVFLSLAECVGCSLKEPPEFATSRAAVAALRSALEVLQLHTITINSAILRDIFWYHCGIKYPERGDRVVHWDLIASLIELDASIFVTEPRSISNGSKGEQANLTEFLFDHISNTEISGQGFVEMDTSDSDTPNADSVHAESRLHTSRSFILQRIITPMIAAFSRNRNLLGFLRRWDDQLVKSYKSANRKALKEKKWSIWEDRALTRSLAEVFEQSLTQGQIATLVEEHTGRVDAFSAALADADEDVNVRKIATYKKASSSAVILSTILQSIHSDDIVAGLQPQLHTLLVSYASRIRDDRYSASTRLELSWTTLCLLTSKLWPIEIHASLQQQQSLLHPLIEQASKDMTASPRADSPTRTAATLFLLNACDLLQTVSGSEAQVQKALLKIVKNLSASRLEAQEDENVVELFCASFVHLLSHLDLKISQESILAMFGRLSSLDDIDGDYISGSLAEAVFEQGSSTLNNAFSSALSAALGKNDEGRLRHVALQALLQIQPSALSREKREAILDRISSSMSSEGSGAVEELGPLVQLMAVPNASAKISTDGVVIFDIAKQLQKQGAFSRTTLQQLQLLCQRVLGHIIPNQSQAQSRAFLGEYQKKLNTLTEGRKKVSATGLAILRATILEQKDSQLLSLKQYIGLLKQCLTDDGTEADDIAAFEDVLEAFNELSSALLGDPTSLKATTTWLRAWIKENADLDSYVTSSQSNSVEVAEYVARLHKLVAKYRLYPDAKWLIALTMKLLRGPLNVELKRSVLATVTEVLTPLETTGKLDLVAFLTEFTDPPAQSASYSILKDLISSLPDKALANATHRQKQLAILPTLCTLLAETSDAVCFNALMDSIDAILNSKASFTSQHSIECVLSALVKITSRSSPALSASHASHIFTRLCETSRLILLVHRNKAGGRSHLIITLLQGLLFLLFMPTSARSGALPFWLRSNNPTEPTCLTPANAAQYTRLLSTLCNPPQSSISKAHQHSRKSKDLNDPVKAARERTSHFLYPLLASFCRFQLSGRLLPAVRVKLMPGLWEVVGTASLHKEGLDAMFAGLSRSERDVWRSVWGEYESVHGRKERFVGED